MDICTDSGSNPDISTKKYGALVYKLGRHPFTVEKAERYRHALQNILLRVAVVAKWSHNPNGPWFESRRSQLK